MENINVLKKDLITIAKTVNAVDKALEDNKISGLEWFEIGKAAVGFFQVIKTWKEAVLEVKDLTPSEKDELIEVFKETFDLKNDVAEMMVEGTIDILLGLIKTAG